MTGVDGCALIVTYHPPVALAEEVAKIRSQCARVFLIDNGSPAADVANLKQTAAAYPNVELIANPTNVGLAAALNQGCRLASERGFAWILFLDQDTDPLPNMVDDLLAAWRTAAETKRVGVVGSNRYDELGRLAHPATGDSNAFAAPFVITSGSLSPLSIFDAVGPFRDDFFIDVIDIEFGYRLEAAGFQSLMCRTPTMRHVWGHPKRVTILGIEIMLTNHSPFRRYFIVRNRVYLETRWWPKFPGRCTLSFLRIFVNIAVVLALEDNRWAKAKAMALGFVHGLIGRLGSFPPSLNAA